MDEPSTGVEDVDVVIVGAGISGICAAARLRRTLPDERVVILEARDAIGGTWDLFRFPGVRSDSDMYTLSFPFRPWRDPLAIVPGDRILDYVRTIAAAERIDRLVRYRHRVRTAEWDSGTGRWTLGISRGDAPLDEESPATETVRMRCRFLLVCGGYYRYASGYIPELPGLDDFRGQIVHPQHWPADLEVEGRRVVVIGSGATAVTLVPALADRGARVRMLQRSPTWMGAVRRTDPLARIAHRILPPAAADRIVRGRSVLASTAIYRTSRSLPGVMRAYLLRGVRRRLPAGYDIATHFTPSYGPWDQRMCAVPGGDLFREISNGSVEIVTDTIERIVPQGVRTGSGRTLEADLIVTATGLVLAPLGGVRLTVDGDPIDLATRLTYKGMMVDGVPNLAFTMGYINASWTLKVDLVARQVCRLLRRMRLLGLDAVTPAAPPGERPRDFLPLTSGYARRGLHLMPKQGTTSPWRANQSYLRDLFELSGARLTDGLRFTRRQAPHTPAISPRG